MLTSSLKVTKNVTQSVTKSVKFKSTRYTREISNENVYDREEMEENFIEETNDQDIKVDDGRKKLEFLEEEEYETDDKSESQNLVLEETQVEPLELKDQRQDEKKQENDNYQEKEK